ncbi:hypothetical protein HPB49_019646 [Dermacentor silvarum]|uniref:Uncharacterized protein n=2 Tax=Dermacentor silvarum TaxID=543639 RepID=A0ACB8CB22_DERSI|nr:hypothetical protein HPB49_019646 [Dermacentor silvarum]
MTWFSQQLSQAQPWQHFADAAKFSVPKAAQVVADRIRLNVGHFRCNYGVIFLVILVCCVMSSLELVGSVVLVAGVCVALKLNEDVETVAVWGTRLELDKNQRLAAAALVALPLLCAADIWSAVVWSAGATVVIGAAHATLHAGPCSPGKFVKTLPDIPEEGDNINNL